MKRLLLLVLSTLMLATTLFAQKTAEEWLNIVDRNMVYKTAESVTKMTVHLPGGTERVYRMNAKVKEDKFALIEFLEPIRDKGTRYLKHEDNMWIYFPRVDRSMLISGHMLREGVQGGDLSFEDLSESSSWADKYTAEIVEEDAISVRIKMTSKDMSVSYPFKEILIDRNTGVPIQTINSGVGEVPIKQILTVETQQFGNRFYPVVIEIRSLLVEDKWTRFEVEKIEFGEDFPDKMFSKEALEVY